MDPLALVGQTPLVELERCSPKPGVRLFAKLEGQNPTGSIKDRIVAQMVEQARQRGSLRPGQTIVEATTGNTGIALAMLGRRLGHPVRVVVPE
jgi:cysteine synthase B